jgi:hypothetical protein
MESLAIVQAITSVILLFVALGVRFAGDAKILNFVEYQRIGDAPALHRWAGTRLLLAALSGIALAVVGFWQPQFAVAIFCAFMLLLGAIIIWLLAGSSDFATLPANYSSKPTP